MNMHEIAGLQIIRNLEVPMCTTHQKTTTVVSTHTRFFTAKLL